MKMKFLLAALVGFSFAACSQDDAFVENKTPETKSPIRFTAFWTMEHLL